MQPSLQERFERAAAHTSMLLQSAARRMCTHIGMSARHLFSLAVSQPKGQNMIDRVQCVTV